MTTNTRNIWKVLTIGLGAFMVGCLWAYLNPINAQRVASLITGEHAVGLLGIALGLGTLLVVTVLSILIPSIIIGFGLGLGFRAAGFGESPRARG